MKILFDDIGYLSYRPRFKCGAEAIVGGALAGIGSLASSIIGSSQSSSNVGSQISAQAAENQKNRDWQTQQAEIARGYNTQERIATQDFALQMMDKQNAYNSPNHQAALLREAGLNPQIALSGTGATLSANPNTSSPQTSPMPSGVSGLSPVGYQPLDLQIPQLLNGVGSFMKNLGEAEKLGVDTDYARASFNMNLKKLSADTSLQEFYAKGVELDNALKSATKDSKIRQAFEECEKVHWDALLSEQQGISEKLQQDVLSSQRKLNEALEAYHGQHAELLKLDCKTYMDAFNLRLRIGQSEIGKNNASARDLNATAEGKELLNNISRATNLTDIDNALFNSGTVELFKQSNQKEELWQELQRNIKGSKAYRDGDISKDVETLLERLAKVCGIKTSVSFSAK